MHNSKKISTTKMKKFISAFVLVFTTLLGCFIISACSENVDDLVIKLTEAVKSNDNKKAQKYAEKACNMGSDFGCYHAGGQHEIKHDYKKAIFYFEKACNMKTMQWSGRACTEAGAIYLRGLDVAERDTAKAEDYFEKGCTLNHGYGCYSAAAKYILGKTAPVDEAKFREYLQKACNLGEELGCILSDL